MRARLNDLQGCAAIGFAVAFGALLVRVVTGTLEPTLLGFVLMLVGVVAAFTAMDVATPTWSRHQTVRRSRSTAARDAQPPR